MKVLEPHSRVLHSKYQPTVECSTYGSEFSAARSAVEQMFDMRYVLRYLGVPIRDKMYLFGDNASVVTSSISIDSKLKKRHMILSYHFVREAVAAGVLHFAHLPGEANPADILSKHWGYQQVWPLLRAILFWEGNTRDLLDLGNATNTPATSPATEEGSNTGPAVSKKDKCASNAKMVVESSEHAS